MIIRGRMRRRTRTGVAVAALLALLALVGCGASASESSDLTAQIRKALDRHPGFTVRSVHCPSDVHRAKGVVTHCSATLRDGHVVALRATQLDSKGTINLIANEMFADNVEHGIVSSLPVTATAPHAACPNHVPVVIGHAFTCTLTGAGRYTHARVTIVNGDGGFRLTFS
jgi:Domain of unknown function (DUF4333)